MGTSTVSKNRRTKAAKSALAIALALVLALSGTFAYLTSQTAVNTLRTTSNPGARLHDDFTWTESDKNKDVYVENFGDKYVLARVKLTEYLERGAGAGTASFTGVPVTNPAGLDKNDPETWQSYNFNSPDPDVHNHFALDFGGSTAYMPTFNKNMKSNEPDVNGSYKDKNGNVINYSNYHAYSIGEELTATETLTGPDAVGTPGGEVTHVARQTLGAELMSMADWKDPSGAYKGQAGPYWVYDAPDDDGEVWVYWAQPIAPGSTTGLLLDNVRLVSGDDDDWYYQLAAIGDFVTPDELDKDEAAGGNPAVYYLDRETDKRISEDAYNLLEEAKARADEAQGIRTAPTAMQAANSSQVADDVANACKVELDGKEYYKLAQDGSRVMLLAKYCVTSPTYNTDAGATDPAAGPFGDETTTNRWITPEGFNSKAKVWCNVDYYDSLPAYTKNKIVDATYKTREQTDSENFIEATSQVFLLSEADVFGTDNGSPNADANCYTYNGRQLIPSGDAGKSIRIATDSSSSVHNWWLRSPRYGSDWTEYLNSDGLNLGALYYHSCSVRPAFWIDLES